MSKYSPEKFWPTVRIFPGYLSQFIQEDAPLENRALTSDGAAF